MRYANLLLVLVCAGVFCSPAPANLYEGSLSSADGGLLGTGIWVNDSGKSGWAPALFTWSVSQNPDFTWHYEYTLSVSKGEVSHFLLETSESFTVDDVIGTPVGDFASWSVGVFGSEGNSNPNIPGQLYGIKFDDAWDLQFEINFDSTRVPVWGNFYSKDGKAGGTENTLWNAGFGTPVPTTPPSEGIQPGFVLVPDTVSNVPEPATLVLLGVGCLAVWGRRVVSAAGRE